MKKKTVSLILALSMILTVLGAMPAFADGAFAPDSVGTPGSTFVSEALTDAYYTLPQYDDLLYQIMLPSDNATYMAPQAASPAALSDTFPYVKTGISTSATQAKLFNNKTGSDFTAIFSHDKSKKVQLNYGNESNPAYYAFDLAHADIKSGSAGAPKYFNRVSVAGHADNKNPANGQKQTTVDEWKLNISNTAADFVGTSESVPGDNTADTLAKWKTIYTAGSGETIQDNAGTVKLDSIIQSRYLMVEVDNVKFDLNGAASEGKINYRISGFQAYLEDVTAVGGSNIVLDAKAKTVTIDENPAVADFLGNLELQDANLQAGVYTDALATSENTGTVGNGDYLITYFEEGGVKEIVSVYTVTAPDQTAGAFTPDSEDQMNSTYVSQTLNTDYYVDPARKDLLRGLFDGKTNADVMSNTTSGAALKSDFPYMKVASNKDTVANTEKTSVNIINNGSLTDRDITTMFSGQDAGGSRKIQMNYGNAVQPIYFAFDLAHSDLQAGGTATPKYFNRVSIGGFSGNKNSSTSKNKSTTLDSWKLNITNDPANFVGTTAENPGSKTPENIAKWKNIYTSGPGETVQNNAGTIKLSNIAQSRYLMMEMDNVTIEQNAADSPGNVNIRYTAFQVYLEDVTPKSGSQYEIDYLNKTIDVGTAPEVEALLGNLTKEDVNLSVGVYQDSLKQSARTGTVQNGDYLITSFGDEIVSAYEISAQAPGPVESPEVTPPPTTPPSPPSDHAITPDSPDSPRTSFEQVPLNQLSFSNSANDDYLYMIMDITQHSELLGTGKIPDTFPLVKVGASQAGTNIFNAGAGQSFTSIFAGGLAKGMMNITREGTPLYIAFDLAQGDVKNGEAGMPKYFNTVVIGGHADNAKADKETKFVDWKIGINNDPSNFVTSAGADATSETMSYWKPVFSSAAGQEIQSAGATVNFTDIIQSRYLMLEIDEDALLKNGAPTTGSSNFRFTTIQVYLRDIEQDPACAYKVDFGNKWIIMDNTDEAVANPPSVSEFMANYTLKDPKLSVGVFSDAAGATEKNGADKISAGNDYLVTYFGEGDSKEVVSAYEISWPKPSVENVVVNAPEGMDIGCTLNVSYKFHDCSATAGHTDQSTVNWYADGTLIEGEHAKEYTLQYQDVGKRITAEVVPNCGDSRGMTVAGALPSETVQKVTAGNLMAAAQVTETEVCSTGMITSMLKGLNVDATTDAASACTIRFRAKLDHSRWITDFKLSARTGNGITDYDVVGYKNGETVTLDKPALAGSINHHFTQPYDVDEIEVKLISKGDNTAKTGFVGFELYSNLTDAEAVAIDKEHITIADADAVVGDLILPDQGGAYTSITWKSSDTSVITDDGVIVIPFTEEPEQVNMTATIKRGNVTDTAVVPIKVYGVDQFEMPPVEGENLAFSAAASSEGELKAGSSPNLAKDGQAGTGWIARKSGETMPALMLDLGRVREINRLRMAEIMSGIGFSIAGYKVETSSDKVTWNPLLSGTAMGNKVIDESFDVTNCRYVKFTVTALKPGGDYCGLREIELYFNPPADYIVQQEKEAVTLNLPYVISADKIELPQPKFGTTFTWQTEGGLIANDGTVTHPKDDTKVTLKLLISYQGASDTKTFNQFLITGTEQKTVGDLSGGGGGGGGRGSSGSAGGGLGVMNTLPQPSADPQGGGQSGETTAGFQDVSKDHWASGYIADLSAKGILTGVGEHEFAPEEAVTREQMAKLLVCAFDVPAQEGTVTFADVPEGDWSAEYIKRAAASGLLQGTSDGVFGIGANMSRQDVAVAIVRVLEKNGVVLKEGNVDSFADAGAVDSYAKSAVAKLYQAGIMVGDEQNTFRPGAQVTRAEAAKIIYETMKLASEAVK